MIMCVRTYVCVYVCTGTPISVDRQILCVYVVLGDMTIFVNIVIGEILNIFILPFQS